MGQQCVRLLQVMDAKFFPVASENHTCHSMSMPISLPNDVVELLQSMVRINSVSGHCDQAESEMVTHNEAIAQAMGFVTRRLPVKDKADNLLITDHVDTALPWLMFESHTDTVAVDNMSIDPFAAEIRDGKIGGRGACDTKGTGAAMLWAMHQYAHQTQRPNNIALLMTVGEESGMTGVRSFIQNDIASLGFEPSGIIVGEPTLCRPVIAHNGSLRWKISTHGVAAHSSTPFLGRSAISMMAKVIDALESQYIPSLTASDALTGDAQCSINLIQGGTQLNIIADHCEIQLDRRLVPGESEQTVLPESQKILDQLQGIDYEQEFFFSCPPLGSQSAAGLLPRVQQVLEAHGLDPEPQGAAYATNGGDMAGTGIPVLVLGPGDIAQAHTKDEWLCISQLELGVSVYQSLMQSPTD